MGGNLATQEWVDNHWTLILWKLAGMAALDPMRELDVDRKRWSWTEMMRQLRYRYTSSLVLDYTY
jgi:breast cancer 2 susceptibility protein